MSTTDAARQRAVFLDIDGTYASHGVVPSAHADAVRAARANGHKVFLCTGRPMSMFPPHAADAGFDGIIAGAGAWVSLGGEVLQDIRWPEELGHRALAALDSAGALYTAEAPERTWILPHAFEAMTKRAALAAERRDHHSTALQDIVELMGVTDDLRGVRFTKLTVFWGQRPLPDIAAELGPEVGAYPSSIAEMGAGAGELYLSHTNKAMGMEVVLDAIGMSPADAIGFGDGLNDIEMLRYAGVGVAMANGSADAIAAADMVVPGPESLGIVEGFRTLGLIAA